MTFVSTCIEEHAVPHAFINLSQPSKEKTDNSDTKSNLFQSIYITVSSLNFINEFL